MVQKTGSAYGIQAQRGLPNTPSVDNFDTRLFIFFFYFFFFNNSRELVTGCILSSTPVTHRFTRPSRSPFLPALPQQCYY